MSQSGTRPRSSTNCEFSSLVVVVVVVVVENTLIFGAAAFHRDVSTSRNTCHKNLFTPDKFWARCERECLQQQVLVWRIVDSASLEVSKAGLDGAGTVGGVAWASRSFPTQTTLKFRDTFQAISSTKKSGSKLCCCLFFTLFAQLWASGMGWESWEPSALSFPEINVSLCLQQDWSRLI